MAASGGNKTPQRVQSVDQFLDQVRRTPATAASGGERRGRLIFALDATASRQPSWDQAMNLQAEMFSATRDLGGLDIQLAYYRGFGEFHASRWHQDTAALMQEMTGVQVRGGRTQLARVLHHAKKEAKAAKVAALVFVGDCVEEDVDGLCQQAGELGLLGTRAFMFHERGRDDRAGEAFRQIAQLSGGAYAPFDANSARTLKDLLGAVAVYAAGGTRALADYSRGRAESVRQLTHQLR